MLHRMSARVDQGLPRVLRLRERLDAKPLTRQGLPTITFGRCHDADFQLMAPGFPIVVSRRHATVTFDGEVYRLNDINACNGTVVRRVPGRLRAAPEGALLRAAANAREPRSNGAHLQRESSAGRVCAARARGGRARTPLGAPWELGPCCARASGLRAPR